MVACILIYVILFKHIFSLALVDTEVEMMS